MGQSQIESELSANKLVVLIEALGLPQVSALFIASTSALTLYTLLQTHYKAWQHSMLCISGYVMVANMGQTPTLRGKLCLKQRCL